MFVYINRLLRCHSDQWPMASVGARSLVERIDAVSRFLASLAGASSYDVAKPVQLQVIHGAINALASLTLDEAVLINEKLAQLTLTPQEKDQLLAAVVAKSCPNTSAAAASVGQVPARKTMQDFSEVHGYLPQHVWQTLKSKDASSAKKLESLLMHCVNLGMRNPSEGSTQVLCALFMLASEGEDAFARLAPSLCMHTFKAIKSEFKRISSRMPPPAHHLQTLPVDFRELKHQAPDLWGAAFGPDSEPEAMPFAFGTLQKAVARIPMRCSRVDSGRASSSWQQPDHTGEPGNVMQQFAVGMMQALQSVQQTQQQLLHAFSGGQVEAPPAPARSPTGLMILAGDSGSAENRFLRRAQSRLALTDLPFVTPVKVEPAPEEKLESTPSAQVAPAGKTVDAAAAAMLLAMESKSEAAKEAKAKVTGKSKSAAKKEIKTEPGKIKKRKAAKVEAVKAPKTKPAPLAKKPCYGHEASRNQYMCRTGGAGKGQTLAIKYNPKKRGDMEAAKSKADVWLKEAMRKFKG